MGILNQVLGNGEERAVEVDFMRLWSLNRRIFIENVMRINGRLLRRLRAQIDRVGIELPTVEVRFEKLSVEADAHVASRGLPTLLNSTLNTLEGLISGSAETREQAAQGLGELIDITSEQTLKTFVPITGGRTGSRHDQRRQRGWVLPSTGRPSTSGGGM